MPLKAGRNIWFYCDLNDILSYQWTSRKDDFKFTLEALLDLTYCIFF